MGFHNPPMSWSEFEGTLSGRRRAGSTAPDDRTADTRDGGDGPAFSHKRGPYLPPAGLARDPDALPYAELHAHSSFSFLDGASSPEELLEEAERLGLSALALVDHDTFAGLVRFAEAAEASHVATVFGAELSLGLPGPQNGEPDPEGSHLVVLARGPEGYHRLASALTTANLRGGEKGRPVYLLDELAEMAEGHWAVLTGCRKGAVRQALARGGADAASRELDALVGLFGPDAVHVELTDHGDPLDTDRNDVLAALAASRGLPVLATGNVHYATPDRRHLAAAVAAVRARRSLDELDGWLPSTGAAHLRSGREMRARFARYPGAIEHGLALAAELAFPLRRAKPALPRQHIPEGHTPMSYLRELVWEAVPRLYPGLDAAGRERIESELAVIEGKDFPGYFLIVHEIVAFAKSRGILCQGRGSAANSAVCYLLGITAVDAIGYRLPFERFLSSLREEEPDIDVDFDSDRREEVIQWVYERYGRTNAAQVANVIQYRPKNAMRDMAKALGYSPGQQDAWSKQVDAHAWDLTPDAVADSDIPAPVLALAGELLKAPRHLGIHSGGMVLTDRPVGEVVPIEHARMKDRTVIQWDKDDAAWMGLVKFDLLGLGMLAALQHCLDLIRETTGEEWTLQSIPKEEPEVYDMLCRADSIGVFQVESRAQMGLLPRLQPRRFYDLVVQIALVRPGPIQGGAVHPFVRRKLGQEEVTYAHPKLEPVLARTLGVPVFQEQLMQMAMAVGNCSGEDADLLRRAMGSKRGLERIERLREKLYAGMAENGLSGAAADDIYAQIQAFANFGFAESHSLSFALLVYASSWIKLHYPAAFLAGLLRAQPMGFYSPATLTADARRHGVQVRRPDIQRSGAAAGLEPLEDGAVAGGVAGAVAVRLGLAGVRGIGDALATRIVAARDADGPFRAMEDLVRRVGLTTAQLEALATAGAFESLGVSTREALWRAGAAAQDRAEFLAGTVVAVQPPLFTDPTAFETLAADLWATGISPDDHPVRHLRPQLAARGVLSSEALRTAESGRRIEVAGLVTHRQRPATASGITFMNLEDETGLVNVICGAGFWARHRRVARDEPAVIVRGMLERSAEGVVNVLADDIEPLRAGVRHRSRDFR
ncbi:error-prone DNA polymerase [Protaetiibacter larvae]|uniref:Error-prone DNA polymerase n=1 Tax=Protaetiibacter larvae TaxID=2592654 RepID=A0A5C1Y9G0_9MICO|nr:error-prone DNA polymerase [Protaetiibacter larvae]QEO10038.1 error-prone DNA polymerase [Protaetiibacter larvae]